MNDPKMEPKDHFEVRRMKVETCRIHFTTSLHTGVEAWSITGTPPTHIFAVWALKVGSFYSLWLSPLVVRNHFILKPKAHKTKSQVFALRLHLFCLSPQGTIGSSQDLMKGLESSQRQLLKFASCPHLTSDTSINLTWKYIELYSLGFACNV